MRLLRIPEPFDHPDWLFEPKMDGFRALAHVDGHRCALVSRHGHHFKSWPQLAEEIAHSVRAHSAVLDGEVCCLDADGRSNFTNLLFRRERPFFLAFDVLACDGMDLRDLPLIERKRRLRRIMPNSDSRVLLMEHVVARGIDLFTAACDQDLEGVVAMWQRLRDRRSDHELVENQEPEYSQMVDRHELFQQRRSPPSRRMRLAPTELILL